MVTGRRRPFLFGSSFMYGAKALSSAQCSASVCIWAPCVQGWMIGRHPFLLDRVSTKSGLLEMRSYSPLKRHFNEVRYFAATQPRWGQQVGHFVCCVPMTFGQDNDVPYAHPTMLQVACLCRNPSHHPCFCASGALPTNIK